MESLDVLTGTSRPMSAYSVHSPNALPFQELLKNELSNVLLHGMLSVIYEDDKWASLF